MFSSTNGKGIVEIQPEPLSEPLDLEINSQEVEQEASAMILSQDQDPFPRYMFFSLLFQGLILFLAVIGVGSLLLMAIRRSPTYVQVNSGEVILAEAFSNTYRSPEVIKRFAATVAQGLFNWSSTSEATDQYGQTRSTKDSGKQIVSADSSGGQQLIPTTVWKAGFFLEPSFRDPFLKRLAALIPASVWRGASSSLQFRFVSDPVQISPGRWKVAIISDMSWNNAQILPLTVNKVFYIEIAQPSPSKAGDDFQSAVADQSKWGLAITDIKDYEDEKDDFINHSK